MTEHNDSKKVKTECLYYWPLPSFLFAGVIYSISHRAHLPSLAALHTRKYEVWRNRQHSLLVDSTGQVSIFINLLFLVLLCCSANLYFWFPNFLFSFLLREILIDQEIERRVALMQTVIELGRVVRERKTLPLKVGIANSASITTYKAVVWTLWAIWSIWYFFLQEGNWRETALVVQITLYVMVGYNLQVV